MRAVREVGAFIGSIVGAAANVSLARARGAMREQCSLMHDTAL
jgi:hypothetical protein